MKRQLIIGLLALGISLGAYATPITGGISFFGSYTPQNSSAVTEADLAAATQIAFGTTVVGLAGTSGSFTVIPDLNPVTMFSPLVFVPPTVPGSDLWSTTAGANTFTFALTTMVVSPVSGTYPGAQALTISGNGTISYAGALGYTPTDGTFTATFNAGGATFSWSSSTAAGVPDGGTTVALLGFGLLSMFGLRSMLQTRTVKH